MAHGTWSAAWPDCAPQMRRWGYRAYSPACLRRVCPSVAARQPHPLPLIVPCVACAARSLACRHLSCACSMHSGCQILDRCSQWLHWSTVGRKVSPQSAAQSLATSAPTTSRISRCLFCIRNFCVYPGFFCVCGFCLFEWKKKDSKKNCARRKGSLSGARQLWGSRKSVCSAQQHKCTHKEENLTFPWLLY